MRLKLTEDAVARLPVDGKDRLFFDAQDAGFGVRVTPAGAKIFVAQSRIAGKSKRIPIGRSPAMKVTAARAEARLIFKTCAAATILELRKRADGRN